MDEDTGQSWGTGDALVGPADALMLAACGRTAAFDRLTGPAVPVLRARLQWCAGLHAATASYPFGRWPATQGAECNAQAQQGFGHRVRALRRCPA